VARGEEREASAVDIAVVGEAEDLPQIERSMREALREAEDKLAFTASVVAVDTDDVLRLGAANDLWWTGVARDAVPILGDPPDILVGRLRRRRKDGRRKAS
jgi:predicted nucleotidyltransferase